MKVTPDGRAKEKFLQLKEEHEKVIGDRERKMSEAEKRIVQKEQILMDL